MSQYAKKEEQAPTLSSADIAILIFVIQRANIEIGPYPFKQLQQLSKTCDKLIKLKELIDNV